MRQKWVKVELPKLQQNYVRSIDVGGKLLTLVREDGVYRVFQAKCPHAGAALFNGWCEKGKLICPVHRYSYDLVSGKGSEGQGDYLTVYPTKLKADGFYVAIKQSFWSRIFS